MALNASNSSNLQQLALKGLTNIAAKHLAVAAVATFAHAVPAFVLNLCSLRP